MLGGMRALPDDGWSARGDGSGEPPVAGDYEACGVVRHGFTHFSLELTVLRLTGDAPPTLPGEGTWWTIAAIEEAGLPTLFAKAARLAIAKKG